MVGSAMSGGVMMRTGVTSTALTALVASLLLSSAVARTIRESVGSVNFDTSLLVDPKTLSREVDFENVPLATGGDRRQLQASTCEDKLTYCSSWSLQGACGAGYTYSGSSIADYWCPKTCNGLVCRPPAPPGACYDITSWCTGWASSGYCSYFFNGSSITNFWCRKTCGAVGCALRPSPPSPLLRPSPPSPLLRPSPPSPLLRPSPPSPLLRPSPPSPLPRPSPPSPSPPSPLPRPSPPSPSPPSPFPSPSTISTGCVDDSTTLNLHNTYRAVHAAGALIWNATLAQQALSWANYLTSTGACNMVHASSTERGGAGENLYWSMNSAGITRSCSAATTAWYNEVTAYSFTTTPWTSNSATFGSIGHFTQLVWVATKQLGCAAASPAGVNTCYVVVCRYAPAGNIATDTYFYNNVLKGSYSG